MILRRSAMMIITTRTSSASASSSLRKFSVSSTVFILYRSSTRPRPWMMATTCGPNTFSTSSVGWARSTMAATVVAFRPISATAISAVTRRERNSSSDSDRAAACRNDDSSSENTILCSFSNASSASTSFSFLPSILFCFDYLFPKIVQKYEKIRKKARKNAKICDFSMICQFFFVNLHSILCAYAHKVTKQRIY